jgi:hypothetical protein
MRVSEYPFSLKMLEGKVVKSVPFMGRKYNLYRIIGANENTVDLVKVGFESNGITYLNYRYLSFLEIVD